MLRHSLALLSAVTFAGFSVAADPPAKKNGKGPAYTAAPADDANYPLLGEFSGEITVGDATEVLGLQIRPIGGDNFDAMSFTGGLPGQDGVSGESMKLIGRRSGEMVILSGGPWAIFVSKDACTLVDHEGNKLGKLDRVQRVSPTMHAAPPKDALVLFDGTNTEQFSNAQMTDDGLLMQGADVRPMFTDFNLHVEFKLPYMPEASDQSRANSGLYLQSRYECQVLDSFAQDAVFNGCGALYRFKKPDVNMCLPPLQWQTYDIQFTAARWASDGTKIRDAHVTSWVNGVKVQDNVALPGPTGAGKDEAPMLLPIRMQDHGDPVRFRNVWAIDRGMTMVDFPIQPTEEDLAAMKKKAEDAKVMAKAEAKAKADAAAKKKAEAAKQAEADKKAESEKKAAEAKPESDAKSQDVELNSPVSDEAK
ncbi:hypothetical protein K227x_47510 [Rubripirellula lacrimiformis]|uniref:3-keto-alpha-glucoside-1,2-lyase/3-keto-2-hydroxy-glucal hydratase domain-containing protein n=1 Tax=Rubripirellula lacrimiformis TaxID=1930273 RepID=A0A517NGT4_9BACT|nr:DUF1080 domain-containing protein [Rubripirellula lacrimiformis]QDT06342.1 hypothetical protein K227x_47510 [Rubripirellula lacrimiformis]